jgi:hypothetical protein
VTRRPVRRVDFFRPVFLRPLAAAPAVELGRPRRVVAEVPSAILRGRPGRGFLAPAVSSATCWAQRSFAKFPRDVLIVAVSVAGFPHTSHTTIVRSAIGSPFRPEPGSIVGNPRGSRASDRYRR